MLSLVRSFPPKSGGRHCCLPKPHGQFATRNLYSPHNRYARISSPYFSPAGVRSYATETTTIEQTETIESKDEEVDAPRFNALGVQQLSRSVHSQLFFNESSAPADELVELSKAHLRRHDLLEKNTDSRPPITFDLPPLRGKTKTLDEHFYNIGMDAADPYLTLAKEFAACDLSPPPPPGTKWVQQSGWTHYPPVGEPKSVKYPKDDVLVFDVEVLYKESPFAVMACAAGSKGWYVWISPWILGENESSQHLVPLGSPTKKRLIVGHNIGYDRARIKEEYSLKKSKYAFLDTMSLHVATNGMCSRQRPTWLKHRKLQKMREEMTDSMSQETLDMLGMEEEAWISRSSINSLQEVARFHCDIEVDKGVRDQFGILDRAGVLKQLDQLLDYCVSDVKVTHKVYQKVLPHFLEVCPHPVSFAALRHLSSVILPVDKTWKGYIDNAEDTYIKTSKAIKDRLVELAERAFAFKDEPGEWEKDEWLKQLDWTLSEIRRLKPKKGEAVGELARNQKMPGTPKWYRDLFSTGKSTDMNISVRSRIAPILLKLAWDQKPLVWSDVYGWVVRVPLIEEDNYKEKALTRCDMSEESNELLKNDTQNVYYKLPHKDGPTARCASPLAKSYLKYFEDGTLSSEYPLAKEALEMNAQCSYWISARERIKGQMVVYESDLEPGYLKEGPPKTGSKKAGNLVTGNLEAVNPELGIILPQLIPMGTVTRRAVERTWLTASNAKKNRLGSELKAMVKAPPGYVFVGSDVDSQELWIASLVGDAQFKLHGGNAIGFMTLEGTKSAGTDLHSKTANILGISRNNAKIFNYGRIYGAGVKFASTLLKQFNPSLSDAKAGQTSEKLYEETKGKKTKEPLIHDRHFWRGGTESFVFNKLEEFANQDLPRTPVLGAGITEALRREYLNVNVFMPSRINWAIQSSGVDYLHLLVISMEHLISTLQLPARLAITVHDEIRYLVKENQKYRVAIALQIANLWTRAMFSQQMGIEDLPQSCAFFSAVDIDTVLRKEVDMDCITPSQPQAIPPGESLTMTELLDKVKGPGYNRFWENIKRGGWGGLPKIEEREYTSRVPIMKELQGELNMNFLRAQNADDKELEELRKEIIRSRRTKSKSFQRSARCRPLGGVVWGNNPLSNNTSWAKAKPHPNATTSTAEARKVEPVQTYEETHDAIAASIEGLKRNPAQLSKGSGAQPPFNKAFQLKMDILEAKRQVNETRKLKQSTYSTMRKPLPVIKR